MRMLSLLLSSLLVHQATTWQLDDQFGRPHRSSELAGTPVLLIAGGSPAAKTFDAWIDAVLAAYGVSPDSLPFAVIGIADVGNAPRIVHPLIRLGLPRDHRRPVMVDPNGIVSRRYGIDKSTSNQVVLARDGKVLLHLRGIPVDTAGVRRLAETLRAAVRGTAGERRP